MGSYSATSRLRRPKVIYRARLFIVFVIFGLQLTKWMCRLRFQSAWRVTLLKLLNLEKQSTGMLHVQATDAVWKLP